jgi:hypothetical protein
MSTGNAVWSGELDWLHERTAWSASASRTATSGAFVPAAVLNRRAQRARPHDQNDSSGHAAEGTQRAKPGA